MKTHNMFLNMVAICMISFIVKNTTDFLQIRQIIKTGCKGRGFSKVSIYNEVKQENGIYTFLFYRVYESYMGMRNNAKKTFNRRFVEVV